MEDRGSQHSSLLEDGGSEDRRLPEDGRVAMTTLAVVLLLITASEWPALTYKTSYFASKSTFL